MINIQRKIYEIVFIHYPVEADTEEDVELLIFDRNTSTKLTRSDVFKVTNKANLTGHGYKEEVSYQTVMSPESTSYFKASTMILAFGIQWNKSISKTTPFFVRNQNRVQFHRFKVFSFPDRFCFDSTANGFPYSKVMPFFFLSQESYFYYKLENCSRIPEIEEELETLIPGKLTVIQCITIDILSQ